MPVRTKRVRRMKSVWIMVTVINTAIVANTVRMTMLSLFWNNCLGMTKCGSSFTGFVTNWISEDCRCCCCCCRCCCCCCCCAEPRANDNPDPEDLGRSRGIDVCWFVGVVLIIKDICCLLSEAKKKRRKCKMMRRCVLLIVHEDVQHTVSEFTTSLLRRSWGWGFNTIKSTELSKWGGFWWWWCERKHKKTRGKCTKNFKPCKLDHNHHNLHTHQSPTNYVPFPRFKHAQQLYDYTNKHIKPSSSPINISNKNRQTFSWGCCNPQVAPETLTIVHTYIAISSVGCTPTPRIGTSRLKIWTIRFKQQQPQTTMCTAKM